MKIRWSKTVFQIGDNFVGFEYLPRSGELHLLANPRTLDTQGWRSTFWALLDRHYVGDSFDFDEFVEAFWRELRAVDLIDVNQIVRRVLSEKRAPFELTKNEQIGGDYVKETNTIAQRNNR